MESEAIKSVLVIEMSNVVTEKKEWLLLGIDATRYSSLRKLLLVTVLVFTVPQVENLEFTSFR